MFLKNLNELNEVQETMKTNAALQILWKDDQISWNPDMYGGLNAIFVPEVKILLIVFIICKINNPEKECIYLKDLNFFSK